LEAGGHRSWEAVRLGSCEDERLGGERIKEKGERWMVEGLEDGKVGRWEK